MSFSPEHLAQLEAHGITPEEAQRQLGLLRNPPAPADLRRPCTIGDGLKRLDDAEFRRLGAAWMEAVDTLSVQKFVPASGAATRMFKSLHALRGRRDPSSLDGLKRAAADGDSDAQLAVSLFERIAETAVCGPLGEVLGRPAREVLDGDEYLPILDAMLDPESGLGLGALPKGLIPFHLYPEGPRTATEEHLVEGLGFLNRTGTRRFHFTVSPSHRERFETVVGEAQRATDADLEISFSIQDPATDTIAIDADRNPLVHSSSTLVFRPAGHGALLANLARLDADVVFVKNIDNVVPEPSQGDTIAWKRALAGLAIEVRRQLFAHLDALESGTADLEAVWRFVDETLPIEPPAGVREGSEDEQRAYLVDRLDRPLRVCGMVQNEGEPGGGPFWVASANGELAPQIVESAQVDLDSEAQSAIWSSSTHFNPVDLVCCLRRRDGSSFDLDRFCDPSASFVASKSFEGKPITVLERPGLWNGSMAGWNTLFVEVPITTFSPVKTILDLLKPQHQVEGVTA